MSDELVTLSTHSTILEAEMVKALLEGEGIEVFIQHPHANALYPGVLGEIKVQIREEDVEVAREILDG
jgi:hypothetical protein